MAVFGHYRRYSAVPALSWHVLTWPKELDAKQVHAWLQALGGNKASRGVRFVVAAKAGSIQHFIALPSRHEQTLLQHLASFLPDIELTECEPVNLSAATAAKVRMTSKNRVLDTNRPEVISHAILSALQALHVREQVVFEWVLGRCKSPATIPNNIADFRSGSMMGAVLEALAGGIPTKLDPVARKSMRDKHAAAAWDTALLLGVTAGTKRRRVQLLSQITGAIKSAEAPGVRLGARSMLTRRLSAGYTPVFWPLLINVDELTGLLAWPLGDRVVPGLQRVTSRLLPVPANMPKKGPVIAEGVAKDRSAKLVLSPPDNLMHLHVLGPTGVGKSTLLLNLMTQHIAAGLGVVVIDPKGDLVHDVLGRIPASRHKDVVVLDPSDMHYPVGLNPLASAGQSANLVADDMLAIFRKLYGSYFGPRTQDILHSGLLTLMSVPGMSLCALPALYTDTAFRARLVGRINDPLGLGSFWNWYEGLSMAERNTAIAPLMNKLRAFLLRPNIRLVMGQTRPKLAVADVFTKRKILLVNLAKGRQGGEAAQLFGSLVVSQVMQAIWSRANVLPAKRREAFFYVDEVQDYLHTANDINEVLDQARGYRVGMVLAHQHLGQLTKELRNGLSNTRSRVCFQLGHDDAAVMAKTSTLLTPADFEGLGLFQIYAKLVHSGHVSHWMSGQTLPPSKIISDPEALKQLSRERYGVPAADVVAELNKIIAPTPVIGQPGSIGRKKRGVL